MGVLACAASQMYLDSILEKCPAAVRALHHYIVVEVVVDYIVVLCDVFYCSSLWEVLRGYGNGLSLGRGLFQFFFFPEPCTGLDVDW